MNSETEHVFFPFLQVLEIFITSDSSTTALEYACFTKGSSDNH